MKRLGASRAARPAWSVAVTFLALSALVACGSDDDDTTAGSTTSDTASVANDDPVRVMVYGQINAPTFGFPEAATAAEARLQAENDAGGLNGRPIEVVVCDDKGDPNEARACAQKAVDDEVAAVIGFSGFADDQVLPLLENAGIAYINSPLGPINYTSPVSVTVDAGSGPLMVAVAQAMADAGCEKTAILVADHAAALPNAALFAEALEVRGRSSLRVIVPLDVIDVGPMVSSALDQDADCIVPFNSPATDAKIITAIRQSSSPDTIIGGHPSSVPQPVLDSLGEASEGFISASPYLYPDAAGAQQFVDELRAHAPDTPANDIAEKSWTLANLFTEAASTIDGDITAASVLTALNAVDGIDLGSVPDFSARSTHNLADYERITNWVYYPMVVESGTFVQDSESPIDVLETIEAISE